VIANKKYSLSVVLNIIILSITVFVVSLLLIYNYFETKEKLYKNLNNSAQIATNTISNSLTPFIESYSINEYQHLLEHHMEDKNILAIIVKDKLTGQLLDDKFYLSGIIRDDNWDTNIYVSNDKYNNILETSSLQINHIIISSTTQAKIGEVTLYVSDRFVKDDLDILIKKSLFMVVIISLILFLLIYIIISKTLLKPINNLVRNISNIDEKGIPKEKCQSYNLKEISVLSTTVNTMIDNIENSRKSLEDYIQRYELILDGINDGIWDWDLKTDKVYFSKRWKEMLGYKEDEFENNSKAFFEAISDEYKIKAKNLLDEHFKDPEKNIYSLELKMKTKDGGYKWILTRGKAVLHSDGTPLRMLGSHTDITERKKNQQEILNQKKEFESIFKYAQDGIAVVDLETRFLKTNDAFTQLIGYSQAELLNKTCLELTIPEDREKNKKAVEEAIEKGHCKNTLKSCTTVDGNTITVDMSISLLPDKKTLILVLTDITSIKLMEEQAKLASMGEMIGNIAHQWRQPLSVISTGATGMKLQKEFNTLSDEDFNKTCDVINENAQYLSKTIDDFRNFIKGDSIPVSFDLKNSTKSFINLVDSSIKKYNIEVVLDLEEHAKVKGYPNELVQCFINIFNNAKDALVNNTSENERYIFISQHIIDNQVVIEFKDNAGGIPDHVLPHIFEPYFTTKHKSQGTGLGLHMTYKLITDGMKGTITASNVNYEFNNKKYKGAKFTIKLPL
jgi:PAS domain S-box-containing protein